MDSNFKLNETESNRQKLTIFFANFKDAFANDSSLLKIKENIKNFGLGSWRPGLALEASLRLKEMKEDAVLPGQENKMTLDRAKVMVMQEKIKSLEQDITALLSDPDEKHVFSTGIFSGVKYQRMCEIARSWNDEDEERMFLSGNITSLQSDFKITLEDIGELRGLQREVDPVDASAESLVDLVQKEWFLVESLHRRVVYMVSSFDKITEAEVQKLTQ